MYLEGKSYQQIANIFKEEQINDYITIGIQLEEKSYCYYTNTKENIYGLSKMPNGLYEWVEAKIEL